MMPLPPKDVPDLIPRTCECVRNSQVALVPQIPPANAGDVRDAGSVSGLGRSLGGGHGNLLHYTCLENSKDGGESMGSHRVEHD